ncbi:(2Fe-2S)-binding protein [Actinoplanes subtropicus]|uniref:(2Fe-2S)-binding protein n=1 Tax=Actinoplanes subtropicus TaxID=543632 RepID=UPI0006920070|nr:(2Fe-2S)-binding protein [Actinoplanes subtropicus]
MRDAGPVLSRTAELGPYFAWEPWDGDAVRWRPFADLLDVAVVAERVGVARRTLIAMSGLGEDEVGEREVASITFLGWAARLVSPLLGAVATGAALPLPEIGQLRWREVPGGPLPLAYGEMGLLEVSGLTGPEIAEAVGGLPALVPMVAVFADRFHLPEHLLWGNVASALGGAAGMIADAEPEHAGRAAEVVAALLERAPLAGTAQLERPDQRRERWFLVRHNCCLYYRIPGGGTCGDCVLTPEEVRRQQWQRVLSR